MGIKPTFLVIFSLVIYGAFADDGDVLDLTENSVDSFKATVGQHDAMLVEFCEYDGMLSYLVNVVSCSCTLVWSL